MAAVLTYLQSASSSTNANTITFAGQNLGAEAADRKIVVAITTYNTANTAISSVTIAGQTANLNQANFTGQYTRVAFAEVNLPTGTSGDIVLNSSNSIVSSSIHVYNLTGVSGNAVFVSDISSPYSITHASAINGAAIISVALNAGNGSMAWTNLTENADISPHSGGDVGTASAASTVNSTSSAITGSVVVTGTPSLIVYGSAYWLPAPPVNTVAPVATYDETTLSTTDGTWTLSPSITYQWQRYLDKWTNIASATSSTYTPTITGEYRAKVVGTGNQVVNAFSNSIVLEKVPTDPTINSVYTLNNNRWPEAGSKECEQEIRNVALNWKSLCPINRINTIYFDSELGNDANDGLSLERPKKTLSELNSIQEENTTYKLKGTFRTGTPLALTVNNCTITKWDSEGKPRITGLRLLISANSGAWTNVSGNRWTATLENATSLHRQDVSPESELKIAASTTEVLNNVNSYYISSNVISVNIGEDPNLYSWECNTSADYGSSASGITSSGHGVRIDNIICDHNGYSGFLTSLNQSWGIQAIQIDDKVSVITDCECYSHRLHNIGHLVSGNSGGRTLFENCRFGGCTSDQATHFVDYSNNGANEFILINCVLANGRTSAITLADISAQRGLFSHTVNDSFNIGFGATINCSIDHTVEDPVQEFGNFGNVPTCGRRLEHCKAIHIMATAEEFDGHRTVPMNTSNAFISSYFAIKPKYTAALGVSLFSQSGLFVSSTLDVNWININPPAANFYGLVANTVASTSHPKIISSEIRFKNGTYTSGRYYTIIRESINDSVDKNSVAVNSVFTTDYDTTGAIYKIGLGNDESPDAVFDNNCLYGWTDDTNNHGYSSWLNTIVLDPEPLFGEFDTRLLNAGNQTVEYLSEVDRSGTALFTPGADIGPWGIATNITPELRGQAHIYMQTNNDLFSTPAVWHNPPAFYNYQWQILNPTTGQWDDISGAITNTLTPSTVRRWYRCKITAYYSYAYSPSYFYKIEAPNTEITVNIIEEANLQSQQIATGLYSFQSTGNEQSLVEETYLNNSFKNNTK